MIIGIIAFRIASSSVVELAVGITWGDIISKHSASSYVKIIRFAVHNILCNFLVIKYIVTLNLDYILRLNAAC